MSIIRINSGQYTNSENTLIEFNDLLQEGIFKSSQQNIQYANRAFINMFGYTSLDEVLTIRLQSLFADDEEWIYVRDRLSALGQLLNYRILFKSKASNYFWGILTIRRTYSDGEIILEGSVLDISELVRIEEKLKLKNQELEKLTMELDRFIYSASHDIRSPVSTIMGIINLMKLDLKEDSMRAYVDMMDKSMGRLDHFVRKLVEYSRNSKMPVDDTCIDLENEISTLLESFRINHPAFSKIRLSVEVKAKHPFYSDTERLQLILLNVIKNALDYSDESKTNNILSIVVLTEPNKVTIEIFDNGVGISTSHINHVFDMFYRGTHLSKGSGMGLYTAREALIKVGGYITLDSEYGVGTSVKIEIPNSKKGRLINKKKQLRFPL